MSAGEAAPFRGPSAGGPDGSGRGASLGHAGVVSGRDAAPAPARQKVRECPRGKDIARGRALPQPRVVALGRAPSPWPSSSEAMAVVVMALGVVARPASGRCRGEACVGQNAQETF